MKLREPTPAMSFRSSNPASGSSDAIMSSELASWEGTLVGFSGAAVWVCGSVGSAVGDCVDDTS